MNIWEEAQENSKTFKFKNEILDSEFYIRGCKNCNQLTKHERTNNRQLLGNAYQTVTNCQQCSKPFILEEHQDYDFALNNYTH